MSAAADEQRDHERREEVVLDTDGASAPSSVGPSRMPASDLAHHRRLADARRRAPEEARGEDHGRDREHQPPEDHLVLRAVRGLRGGRPSAAPPGTAREAGTQPGSGRNRCSSATRMQKRRSPPRRHETVPEEPPTLEPKLSVQRAAPVDELARLLELELPRAADARAGPAVGPGDVRLRVPVGAERERSHGEAGTYPEDNEVRRDEPA